MMRDFFGALTPSIIKGNMGSGYDAMVLTRRDRVPRRFVMVVLRQEGREGGSAARHAVLVRHLLGGQRHLPACQSVCEPRDCELCPAFRRHGLYHAFQV